MKFQQHHKRNAKLGISEVVAIRQKYEAGFSQAALCREYGVSLNTIGKIVRYESWQDVDAPATQEGMEAMQARFLKQVEADSALARLSAEIAAKQPIKPGFADESLRELNSLPISHEAQERLKLLKGEGHARRETGTEGADAGNPREGEGDGGGTQKPPDAGYPE